MTFVCFFPTWGDHKVELEFGLCNEGHGIFRVLHRGIMKQRNKSDAFADIKAWQAAGPKLSLSWTLNVRKSPWPIWSLEAWFHTLAKSARNLPLSVDLPHAWTQRVAFSHTNLWRVCTCKKGLRTLSNNHLKHYTYYTAIVLACEDCQKPWSTCNYLITRPENSCGRSTEQNVLRISAAEARVPPNTS